MDDINFEELDKAVNSVLQQSTPKSDPVMQDTSVIDVPVSPAQPTSQTLVPEKPVIQSSPQKRRGQFMDMVHPSSDMIKPASARPSRQAAAITPLNPTIVEGPTDTGEASDTVSGFDSETPKSIEDSQRASEQSEQPTPRSEWPDPLDVMEQTEQENQEPTLEDVDNVVATASDVNEKEDESSDAEAFQAPQTSPFISGTDLEKRPLGAFAEATPPASDVEPLSDRQGIAMTEQLPENDENTAELQPVDEKGPVDAPVPQELAPEVVSVESDDLSHIPTESGGGENDEESVLNTPGMSASIPQQYKNIESPTGDQGDHPVFDTKEYHQPLTPPAKHGHGGLIVALVLLLLAVLGAGAWYAIAVLKLI